MFDRTTAESRWRTPGLVALVLLCGSLVPSPLPRRESWETFGPDKALHFIGHAGFAVTLATALSDGRHDRTTSGVVAVLLSLGYSVILGRLQVHVPGRMPETADLVAGFLGSAVAVVWWHRCDS